MQLYSATALSNDKLTNLCAEKCCRSSETGSAMSVGPDLNVMLRTSRILHYSRSASVTPHPDCVVSLIVPPACEDLAATATNFVYSSIGTSR